MGEEINFTCGDCDSLNALSICYSCIPEEAMPVISDLLRDIPDDDEGGAERSSEQRLMRVHRNLGHPSNRLLVQLLKEAKAPESVIEIATQLECPICARHARTSPARPANPYRARELGHTVAMDFSYHTTPIVNSVWSSTSSMNHPNIIQQRSSEKAKTIPISGIVMPLIL